MVDIYRFGAVFWNYKNVGSTAKVKRVKNQSVFNGEMSLFDPFSLHHWYMCVYIYIYIYEADCYPRLSRV